MTISLLSWQRLSFGSSLSTLGTNFAEIFRIFSSSRIIVCTVRTLTSNYALIVPKDTRRSLSIKFFIWPINSGALTSLLLSQLSSSLTDSLPSLNLLSHCKTDVRFMQDAPQALWSIPYVSIAFFPRFFSRILLHIVLLKCPYVQIAFLKFTNGDDQAFVGCIQNHKN